MKVESIEQVQSVEQVQHKMAELAQVFEVLKVVEMEYSGVMSGEKILKAKLFDSNVSSHSVIQISSSQTSSRFWSLRNGKSSKFQLQEIKKFLIFYTLSVLLKWIKTSYSGSSASRKDFGKLQWVFEFWHFFILVCLHKNHIFRLKQRKQIFLF